MRYKLLYLGVIAVMYAVFFIEVVKGQTKEHGIYKYELFKTGVTYETAKEDCKKRNGWLVEIKNKGINNALSEWTRTTRSWIGISRENNVLKWNNGDPILYAKWTTGVDYSASCFYNYNGFWYSENYCWNKRGYICQSDIESGISYEYHYEHTQLETYEGAKAACQYWNMHLAYVKTNEVKDTIATELKKASRSTYYYVGANDITVEGKWKWEDGTVIKDGEENVNWKEHWRWNNEPNGAENENCLALDYEAEWIDVSCAGDKIHYICQKETYNCPTNFCKNGGSCTAQSRKLRCSCPAGKIGRRCEIDLCRISSCVNGVCNPQTEFPFYRCLCYAPYQGKFCQDWKHTTFEHCQYHIMESPAKSYADAEKYCKDERHELAMVKSTSIHNQISSEAIDMFSSSGINTALSFWIGGKKDGNKWKWSDETNIPSRGETNSQWAWNRPSTESCLKMVKRDGSSRFYWEDDSCTTASEGIICERRVPDTGNPCDNKDCQNQGTCNNFGCQAQCICTDGYGGESCEKDLITIKSDVTELTLHEGEEGTVTLTINSEIDEVEVVVYKGTSYSTIKYDVGKTVQFSVTGQIGNPEGILYKFVARPMSGNSFDRSTSVRVKVISPARITGISRESILVPRQGDWYILCDAAGVPKPTILWYKDGVEVQKTGNKVIQYVQDSFSKLVVQWRATELEAGLYTCRASNTPPNSKELTDERSAYLRVKIEKANDALSEQEIEFNEKHQLSCSFRGYPQPEIKWTLTREEKTVTIGQNEGSIFKITNRMRGGGVVKTVTSNLTVSLAECLGPVEIKCSANNSLEETGQNFIKFSLNQRTKLRKKKNYIFSKDTKNFQNALSSCKSKKAQLIEIKTPGVQEFLAKEANTYLGETHAYIAMNRTNIDGSMIWKWTDGTMAYNQSKYGRTKSEKMGAINGVYLAWGNQQPRNDEDYNCVVTNGHSENRLWYNVPCSRIAGYICVKKATSLPSIDKTEVKECSANIKILWKTSPEAIGIKHRIQFVPMDGGTSNQDSIDVIPSQISMTTEASLSFSTNYTVKIYVCPDECIPSCHTKAQFLTTGGLPGTVQTPNVKQSTDKQTCNITWKKPLIGIELLPYQINITYTLRYISSYNPLIQGLNTSHSEFSPDTYLGFKPLPNRKYIFGIRAQTCSGFGELGIAQGTCITGISAPPSVAKPTTPSSINDDGTVDITISRINEENGPISCVFIIVVIEPEVTDSEDEFFSREELEEMSSISNTTGIQERREYIALAISRKDLIIMTNEDGLVYLKLGDNGTTYCDVISTSQKRRKRATQEFFGSSPPLSNDKNYGFFTVTSTPTEEGEVMFKRSKMSVLGNEDKAANGSKMDFIIPVIIGIVVAICLVLVVILLLLRRRRSKPIPKTDSVPLKTVVPVPEPTYANFAMESKELRSDTDIPLQRLEIIYNSMKANNNKDFETEFQNLKVEANANALPTSAGSDSSVKAKNRYKNILPYDITRVKLSGKGESSYINACFVQGLNHPKKFIATQGPLPNTVHDFWRMIAEQRCNIIVMLTKCFENGKKKCEKYWPEQGERKKYGKVIVQNVAEAVYGTYIKRTLKVTNEQKGEETVQHYQFLKWPDHGVPMTTSSFFRIQKAVAECNMTSSTEGPIVVHCSAGAGRTGAFIAYDYLSEERQSLNRVDVYNCVLSLRQQRVDMVQNCDQYILIHKLLLESYLFGDTDAGPESFSSVLRDIDEETRIHDEFNKLSIVDPIKNKLYGANFRNMNRNKNILPYERNRVTITCLNDEIDVPYVNASYIESYDESYSLIAAQGPVSASVEYFWRAVFDNNVSIIVMLTDDRRNNQEQCIQYWPSEIGETLDLPHISVSFNKQYLQNDIICRDFSIEAQNENTNVIQYQYKGIFEDPAPVLDLINVMQDKIRSMKNSSVLVHCSDGVSRTGTFCAIVNLIERLKCENRVDVFREVKDLRDCRMGMVQTLDQYKFCYLAVSTYLSSFDLYSNFEGLGDEHETVYENL